MDILKTTALELNNYGNYGGDYLVPLKRPLQIKKGSVISIVDAYISLFNGEVYQQGSIVIEKQYITNMKAALTYVNLCDNIPNGDKTKIPFGYNSILTEGGAIKFIDIQIIVNPGIYTPQDLVQIINKQTCLQQYIALESIENNMTVQPINGVAAGNIVPFQTAIPLTKPSGAAYIQFYQPVLGAWNENYGFMLDAVQDEEEYGCPDNAVFLHGSLSGIQIDYDEVEGKFFISRNFSPVIIGADNNFGVIKYPLGDVPPASLGRMYVDKCGQLLVVDWGAPISEFDNTIWARLGFSAKDLYFYEGRTDISHLWGTTYVNINPYNNLMVNNAFMSDSMSAYQIQQQSENQDQISTSIYDGSTIGIYASSQSIGLPIPFIRCRVNLAIAGGAIASGNELGLVQNISLLNLSTNGFSSFGILNPHQYGIDGDMIITSIGVKIEDPRDGSILSFVSNSIMSSITLRIQEIDTQKK